MPCSSQLFPISRERQPFLLRVHVHFQRDYPKTYDRKSGVIDVCDKAGRWATLKRRELACPVRSPPENAIQVPAGQAISVDGLTNKDALIQLTIKVWQPYYAQPLSQSDAIEIICNSMQLLGVLTNGARERE
jgi:hypothetical protein